MSRDFVCGCISRNVTTVQSPVSTVACLQAKSCQPLAYHLMMLRLHENGALGLGSGWWRCRADSRGEDTEVDEPGAWDVCVSLQSKVPFAIAIASVWTV